MKKVVAACCLQDHLIPELIKVAWKNWNQWSNVFEHSGPIADNPVLADKARFFSFCNEYRVHRTIWKGRHDEFRLTLARSAEFAKAIRDDTGYALDKLERDLRPRFGSKGGKNRIVSVLSKVAAFVRPERFVAWDRFAKRGLNIVLGRSASSPFNTYAEYLAAFDRLWEGQQGGQIRQFVTKKDVHSPVEHEPRFLRRVLDVYLMKCGGRWTREGQRM